jgi:hypothetical protein
MELLSKVQGFFYCEGCCLYSQRNDREIKKSQIATHVILNLNMRPSTRNIAFAILIIGSLLSATRLFSVVLASNYPTLSALSPTPMPAATIVEATATVDPASIGDTSGVIVIGMFVVIIILAGVLWGSLDLRQKSLKTRQPKE